MTVKEMTVKELRKALKKCRYQDARVLPFDNEGGDFKIVSIRESHIVAEVYLELEKTD